MTKVWVLQSVYKQDDKSKPANWATSVCATEEIALAQKAKIEARKDIEEVFMQSHFMQETL